MLPGSSPLLYPAPVWQPDLSEYVVLWHGCTALARDSIEANGIDLTRCAIDTDFGRGFYTTTLERQAQLWAWEQHDAWREANPGATGNPPVVLRFRVRRYTRRLRSGPLDDGLDQLTSLQFVRGDHDADDFWGFVQHCRRSSLRAVNDHRCPPTGWYQMVCGPVAAFWKQKAAMVGSDQFSFHAGGTYILDALLAAGRGKGADGSGDPDTYQWFEVR